MMPDPLELLAALNPMPKLNESLPSDEQMLAAIMAVPPASAGTDGRRRRRVAAAAAGTSVVVLGLAAFAVLRRESPADPTAVVCYSDASVPPAAMHVLETSGDPVESCAELWRNGVIASGDPPSLTACVADAGTIAVIPGGRQVCAELGLANWVGEFSTDELRIIDFQNALAKWFGMKCVAQSDAVAQAERLIDEFHLDGWTVATSGNWSEARPCTASGVEPITKTVTVGGRRAQTGEQPPTTTGATP